MTGKATRYHTIYNYNETEDQFKLTKLEYDPSELEFIRLARNLKQAKNYTLTVGTKDSYEGDPETTGKDSDIARGVYVRHAYTVLGLETIAGEDMVVLRNPYGAGAPEAVYNERTGTVSITEEESTKRGGTFVIPLKTMFRLYNDWSQIML